MGEIWDEMPGWLKGTLVGVAILILLGLFASVTPWGRAFFNRWDYTLEKVDDRTTYKTRKEVEDTCRASIANYQAYKVTYEEYAGSEDKEERSWARNAKLLANKTATTYNEYMRKNSFVFEGNIPSDIDYELPLLK